MQPKQKQVVVAYLMTVLDGLASGLFNIFLPVYLLSRGYSVQSVILYYFTYSFFVLLGFLLAGFYANYLGLRRVILLRLPFLFLYIGLLILLPKLMLPLWLIAFGAGVQAAFYYFVLHLLFTQGVDTSNLYKAVGRWMFWPRLLGLFLPLLGAAIAVRGGFPTLLLLVAGVYLLSAVPMWLIDDFKTRVEFSWRNFWRLARVNRSYFFVEAVKNITEEVEGIVWPIFVYLYFRDLSLVGWIATLSGIGTTAFTLLVGDHAKKIKRVNLFRVGVVAMAIIWLLRYVMVTPVWINASNVLSGFVGVLIGIPFSVYIYRNAKRGTADEFFIFREMVVFIGRLPAYLLAYYFWHKLEYGFLLAAAAYLVLSLLPLNIKSGVKKP